MLHLSISVLLTTGTAFSSAHPATQAVAQVLTQTSNTVQNNPTQVLFKPSGGGKPPPTRGAGSRSDRLCPQDALTNPTSDPTAKPLALTALVPSDQSGLTWAERPTVWVYLPKTSARQMVLSVKAGSQPHSQRFLPITGAAGVVGVPLAQNSPPLEVGKFYQWAAVLVCGDRPSPNDPFVTAWVQRVVPAQPLSDRQSALERAVQYGEQGIWYDALTTLVTARRSQPANSTLAQIWADFLAQPSVGLGAISGEPLR